MWRGGIDPYRGEAVKTIMSENPVMLPVQADAASRVAQRAMATDLATFNEISRTACPDDLRGRRW